MNTPKDEHDSFDLLKALWQQDMPEQKAHFFTRQQILELMQQQTTSAVQQLRRNLLLEISTATLAIIGAYGLTHYIGLHFQWYIWAIFILITIGYHSYLYFQLPRKQSLMDGNLLQTTERLLRQLQPIVSMGKWGSWLLALVLLGATALFTMRMETLQQRSIVVLLGSFAIVGGYYSVKNYIDRLYGQYYRQLQECLAQLKA